MDGVSEEGVPVQRLIPVGYMGSRVILVGWDSDGRDGTGVEGRTRCYSRGRVSRSERPLEG